MSSASVMAIRQAHIDGERERKEATVWRNEFVKETTRLWKERFSILVNGRNESANNLKEAFKSASQMTYEREGEMEELLEE